jgi:hypothetical protein
MDYIFWLDADDIITTENKTKLLALKENLNGVDAVTMLYHYMHDENGHPLVIHTRERLLKRSMNFRWSGVIHENISFHGNVMVSDIFVTHKMNLSDVSIPKESLERNKRILKHAVKSGNYSRKDLFHYAVSINIDNNLDEALEYLLRFIDISEDNMPFVGEEAYIKAHNAYLKKGEIKKALQLLLKYENRLKHQSEYYCTLGNFYNKHENDVKKALDCFHKALNCKNIEALAYYTNMNDEYYYYLPLIQLGEIYLAQNDFKNALVYYEKALSYKPEDGTIAEIVQLLKKLPMTL